MIIKNNFNAKNANPLDDYNGIGKGSHNIEREIDKEKVNNINNINQIDDDDNDDDRHEDKWDFFR